MLRRQSIAEQGFPGNGRFLLHQLRGTRTEMVLAVNAYQPKRAINVLGVRRSSELTGYIPLSFP